MSVDVEASSLRKFILRDGVDKTRLAVVGPDGEVHMGGPVIDALQELVGANDAEPPADDDDAAPLNGLAKRTNARLTALLAKLPAALDTDRLKVVLVDEAGGKVADFEDPTETTVPVVTAVVHTLVAAVDSAAFTLLAANGARRGFRLINTGGTTLSVKLGGGANTTEGNYTFQLAAAASIGMHDIIGPHAVYTDVVTARAAAAASGNITVIEF